MFAIAVKGMASNHGVEPASISKTIVSADSADLQSDKTSSIEQQQVLATPAVRRIARENNLNLSLVPSSGKNGRVLKEDALNYLEQLAVGQSAVVTNIATSTAASTVKQSDASSTVEVGSRSSQDIIGASKDILSATQDYIEPIKGVRAIMAKTMMESVTTIPHFTYADEDDMSNLIALRAELKEGYAKQGVRLTMMPFFIKALSLAIKQYPILNSQVNEDCTQLHYLASHNIGMAVDSPLGLLVPNIKNVQDLSIIDIAEHSNRLTELARAGRLSPSDLKGGTITISNVGAIGGTVTTPIITKSEVAIVALGKVQSLPRFDAAGNVTAQKIMTISWSGDHRVIDGATMARFSNTWKAFLENPSSMLMAMS
jgi:2-oxoisovalerate dehydrogenase E2 component (dihydrolipoyl transacylase)